jgi:hypothetical protein
MMWLSSVGCERLDFDSQSVAFLPADLGITKTHTRPHVSNPSSRRCSSRR